MGGNGRLHAPKQNHVVGHVADFGKQVTHPESAFASLPEIPWAGQQFGVAAIGLVLHPCEFGLVIEGVDV